MPEFERPRSGALAESSPKDKLRSLPARFLDFIGSVRCGIFLLALFGFLCFLGMLIMQQNVEGFDRYFADLTPAQQAIFGKLGLFDVYHSWYFNFLIAALSLNIILASVNRFPSALKFIAEPKRNTSPGWVAGQKYNGSALVEGEFDDDLRQFILDSYRKAGWRKTFVSESKGLTVIFGESGAWNRLGAYAVHLGLLTILFGGFLTGQVAQTGHMNLSPEMSSAQLTETVFSIDRVDEATRVLPFRIYCTDIQQLLIDKNGPITPNNTIDWLTMIRIEDGEYSERAVIRTNQPFDYRGYRFFQAGSSEVGRARVIVIRVESEATGKSEVVKIKRFGEKILNDGSRIKFDNFRANYNLRNDNPTEDTRNYQNPAAVLTVTRPGGESFEAIAYGSDMADLPIARSPVGGYIFRLMEFERVSDYHILTIRRDPGSWIVYLGFALLVASIVAVFFFSHQRVWTVIESSPNGKSRLIIGGNANRNEHAFGEKFEHFFHRIRLSGSSGND